MQKTTLINLRRSIDRLVLLFTLIIACMSHLNAQENLRIGMSSEEFRKVRPGILPEEASYSGSIGLADTIQGIPGTWNFTVHQNKLVSAQFHWNGALRTEEEFHHWVRNARAVHTIAQKVWGAPREIADGEMDYHSSEDVQNADMGHGGRDLEYDMVWQTPTARIHLSCDYRSNYYPPDPNRNTINGPIEMFSYQLGILFERIASQGDGDQGPNVTAVAPIVDPKPMSDFSPENVRLGMSMTELKAAFPRIQVSGSDLTGQFNEDTELKGLEGSWTYQFEKGLLKRWGLSFYERKLSEDNFNKCLSVADDLVADFDKRLGKAETFVRENVQYVDPYKKRHWGYKVITASWSKPDGATSEVRFKFFGGKGDYFFVVEAAQQQK